VPEPFVIAEAGSSHDGVFDNMLACIKVAHRAGANAVKFQWHSDSDRLAARMNAPEARDTYARYAWPKEWLPMLSKDAHAKGLEFLCTVDLVEDIEVVAPYVDRFKIASWGATNVEFCQAHVKFQKPLIISTGCCDINEFLPLPNPNAWVLHCVSAYPAPLEEANLGVIARYGLDGWSDHTANPLTGALAVAAGARILEVHFRLDETEPTNPDYVVSLSPGGLRSYIWLARRAAEAMGDGIKRCMPSEERNRRHRYV
jgi:sialic acid synthase SpsE